LPEFVGSRDAHAIAGGDGVLYSVLPIFIIWIRELPHIKIFVDLVSQVKFLSVKTILYSKFLCKCNDIVKGGACEAGEILSGDSADGKKVDEGGFEGFETNIALGLRGCGGRGEGG
jgi:hypothetical protein